MKKKILVIFFFITFIFIVLLLFPMLNNKIKLKVINNINSDIVFSLEGNILSLNMPLLKKFNSTNYKKFVTKPMDCNSTQNYTGFIVPLKPTIQTINPDCIRATKNYCLTKSKNITRIIVLGDSFIFGEGVNDNETIPALLQKKMNSERYEFLNFGVPGYNTKLEVNWFKRKGLKYNPDMVLLGYVSNDCEDAMAIKNLDSYIAEMLEKRNIPTDKVWEIRKQLDYSKYFPFNKTFALSVSKPMNELYNLSKEYNFSVIVFSYPLNAYTCEKNYLMKMEKLTRQYRFPFYYLPKEINYTFKGKWILDPKDVHPTLHANEKTADFLVPIILNMTQNSKTNIN